MAKLDEEVEKKFAQRLNIAVRVWIDVLTDRKRKQDDDDTVIRRRTTGKDGTSSCANVDAAFSEIFDAFYSNDTGLAGIGGIGESDSAANRNMDMDAMFKIAGEPKIKKLILEILIKNQVLYVSPSTEDAREHLISQLYEFASVVTTQKRIQHSRYQVCLTLIG